jgi:hypothetical protein
LMVVRCRGSRPSGASVSPGIWPGVAGAAAPGAEFTIGAVVEDRGLNG